MTTVFASGSRRINRLNKEIILRLQNIINKQFKIIVGDANGADKAVQKYLLETNYNNVVIFCAGNSCRNNLGNWEIKNVVVDPKLKGRDFYTQKDKKMAEKADYGFVLWDGISPGSLNNIMELLKKQKKALVYFSPTKEFYKISKLQDALNLLNKCDQNKLTEICRKIKLSSSIRAIESLAQGTFSL